jgi:hypothetical protein
MMVYRSLSNAIFVKFLAHTRSPQHTREAFGRYYTSRTTIQAMATPKVDI